MFVCARKKKSDICQRATTECKCNKYFWRMREIFLNASAINRQCFLSVEFYISRMSLREINLMSVQCN